MVCHDNKNTHNVVDALKSATEIVKNVHTQNEETCTITSIFLIVNLKIKYIEGSQSQSCWKKVLIQNINASIWFCWMKKTSSLIEDKRNDKAQGPTLVGTPKRYISLVSLLLWPCTASFGL